MAEKDTTIIHLRIENGLLSKLTSQARKEFRTVASILRQLIAQHVGKK